MLLGALFAVTDEEKITAMDELEKYSIWNWNSTKKNKRLLIEIPSNNIQLPTPEEIRFILQLSPCLKEHLNLLSSQLMKTHRTQQKI